MAFAYSLIISNLNGHVDGTSARALQNALALGLGLQNINVNILNSHTQRRKLLLGLTTEMIDVLITVPYYEQPREIQGADSALNVYYMSILNAFVVSGNATMLFKAELLFYDVPFHPDLTIVAAKFLRQDSRDRTYHPTISPTLVGDSNVAGKSDMAEMDSAPSTFDRGIGFSIFVGTFIFVMVIMVSLGVYGIVHTLLRLLSSKEEDDDTDDDTVQGDDIHEREGYTRVQASQVPPSPSPSEDDVPPTDTRVLPTLPSALPSALPSVNNFFKLTESAHRFFRIPGRSKQEYDIQDEDIQDEDVQGEELSKSTSQVDIIVDHQLTSSS